MAGQRELQTLRKRELGEIIGDAFKIFFRNFKTFSYSFLVFVVPIFLVLGFAIVFLGGNAMQKIIGNDVLGLMGDLKGLLTGMGLLYVGLFLCYMSTYNMVYAGLKAYRENGDEPFSFDALKENYLKYIIPVSTTYFFIVLIIMAVAFVPTLIFGLLSPLLIGLGVFLIMPFAIYLAILTCLMPIIRVEEELSFTEAYYRSKYLIKNNWWSMFGIVFIAALIAGMLAVLFNIPYLIFTMGADLSGIGGEEGTQNVGLMLSLSYLLGLIGGLFTSIYTQIALGLKYYDLVEKKDNTNLQHKIDSLGTSQDSFFENEGEY